MSPTSPLDSRLNTSRYSCRVRRSTRVIAPPLPTRISSSSFPMERPRSQAPPSTDFDPGPTSVDIEAHSLDDLRLKRHPGTVDLILVGIMPGRIESLVAAFPPQQLDRK